MVKYCNNSKIIGAINDFQSIFLFRLTGFEKLCNFGHTV